MPCASLNIHGRNKLKHLALTNFALQSRMTSAGAGAEVELSRERSRTMTSTEEINSTITRPGSVKINVKGAFIVDPDTSTPAAGATNTSSSQGNGQGSPTHHETSDIRLPNHTAVVSHIAVDVRICCNT